MENQEVNRTHHEVVTAKREGTDLYYSRPAGYALHLEGARYFILKLWMLPKTTFFVAKSSSSENDYVVFTKKIDLGDEVKFQNPVGFGKVRSELNTHLEIIFNVPRMFIYMSLFPTK